MKNKLLLTLFLLLTSVNFAFAEIPIYCHYCKVHLYNYQKDEIIAGAVVYAADFKPAREDIGQPKEAGLMVCPFDNAPLNAYEYVFWEKQLRLPEFHYPAISLLSKDEKGNWFYIPYYKPVIENWEGKR